MSLTEENLILQHNIHLIVCFKDAYTVQPQKLYVCMTHFHLFRHTGRFLKMRSPGKSQLLERGDLQSIHTKYTQYTLKVAACIMKEEVQLRHQRNEPQISSTDKC